MRCPDCNKEVVGYNKEYCPHCGGDLKSKAKQHSFRVMPTQLGLGRQDVAL